MAYRLNQPVWVLGQVEGYFERYVDDRDHFGRVVVGVPSHRGGMGAVVPREWLTNREEEDNG